MQQYSTRYIFLFSAAVCLACSMVISVAAVGLRDRQNENMKFDQQKSVLWATWMVEPGEKITKDLFDECFGDVRKKVLDLTKDAYADDVDPETFAPKAGATQPAPPNAAQVSMTPDQVLTYQVMKDGAVAMIVLPIQGKGLWSTMYGYLALDADGRTIRGLYYYQQGETPGLGGEVMNPRWLKLWPGRLAFDDGGKPAIQVIKGTAGPASEDPYQVDGLSGATITSRGVSNTMAFWLGEHGYGPFLEKFRADQGSA